jgi:hypothetical protein
MNVQQLTPASFELTPDNDQEALTLDGWYRHEVRVINRKSTFEGKITGLIFEIGNER